MLSGLSQTQNLAGSTNQNTSNLNQNLQTCSSSGINSTSGEEGQVAKTSNPNSSTNIKQTVISVESIADLIREEIAKTVGTRNSDQNAKEAITAPVTVVPVNEELAEDGYNGDDNLSATTEGARMEELRQSKKQGLMSPRMVGGRRK